MKAAVVGCGVIGSGWVARLRFCGHDVVAFDPSPDSGRILGEVFQNARRAWERLGLPTDSPGQLTEAPAIADAVDGADFVQESVPERLDLKHTALADIEAAARDDTLIASSTSGLRPSELQAKMRRPQRLVVGHPFNPVYLMPLVEVVGGRSTAPESEERAMAVYRELGMYPLLVRVEVDAFIADRLMEAMWREALWLVRDGVATTAEIDDAIRFGFGLRWAQMGLFDTYRIAGGEGGMSQFLVQFGEALHWPWSRLTDVPKLDHELVAAIVEQSDSQSGGRSPRELERIRDDNLVAILLALEQRRWGAGETLAGLRRTLGA